MQPNELINSLKNELALDLPKTISLPQLKKQLTAHINHLIAHDFEKLLFYLYRIDVDEKKMKTLLQHPHENTGELIAQLIIARQMEKIKKKLQHQQPNIADDEERW